MSNDQTKNSNPFFEFHHESNDHHSILSQGFSIPTVTNFNPFMYNHPLQPPLQNPNEFDFLQGAVEYNTLSAPNEASGGGGGGGRESIPMTPNSSASFSSQEAGAEEDSSSKSKKDVQTTEEADGKSKNVKAKEKEGKKQKQPRFAFMTKSEVDNLEDGYRWRKYGQKAVKNSPFPRSYYRCTSQKCGVKKRIERSYQDPAVVITTYEGQHNHHSPSTMRGSAASMLLAPPPPPPPFPTFSHDMFFARRGHSNPTAFYTQLADPGRHHHDQQRQPEVLDQYGFLMPGAGSSSFLQRPEP